MEKQQLAVRMVRVAVDLLEEQAAQDDERGFSASAVDLRGAAEELRRTVAARYCLDEELDV